MPLPTPQRLSIMLGLLAAALATLPRYLAGGHETRISLILLVSAVLAAVAVVHWRMLPGKARRELPWLLRRLGFCLLGGLAVMAAWYALSSAWVSWQLILSHGMTLGLLAHVLGLWWKREPE